jgi:hypothetical protein
MIALKDNLGSEFVERVRGFFSEKGPLSKAKNFAFRAGTFHRPGA